jgi:hypothetical protein
VRLLRSQAFGLEAESPRQWTTVEVIMDREGQRGVVRARKISAFFSVMMIVVCIVLSFALPPEEQQEVRLALAVLVSMSLVVPLSLWLFRPTKFTWPTLVLQLSVCVGLAASSFWLWQRAEQPIVAVVFCAFYTVLALLRVVCQIAISRLQAASRATGASGSQPGFAVQAEPEGRNESASDSA